MKRAQVRLYHPMNRRFISASRYYFWGAIFNHSLTASNRAGLIISPSQIDDNKPARETDLTAAHFPNGFSPNKNVNALRSWREWAMDEI